MKPYLKYLTLPVFFAISFIVIDIFVFIYNSRPFLSNLLIDNRQVLWNEFFYVTHFRLLIPVMVVIFLFSVAYKQTKLSVYNLFYVMSLIAGVWLVGYVSSLSFSFLMNITSYVAGNYVYVVSNILFYVFTIGVVNLIGLYYFQGKEQQPIACQANEIILIILCLSGLFGYIGFILSTHIPALSTLGIGFYAMFGSSIASFLVYVLTLGIAFTCLYAWLSKGFLARKLAIYIGSLLEAFIISGFLIVGILVVVFLLCLLFPLSGMLLLSVNVLFMVVFVFMLTRSRYKSYILICLAAYIIPMVVMMGLLDNVSNLSNRILYLAAFPFLLLIFYGVTNVSMKPLLTHQ